jgi:hypothetical protein
MTFTTYAWSVDGNTRIGADERMMVQHAIDGNQGVLNPLDCQVQATGPPSQGVLITPGSAMVLGQEITQQGMYHAYNVGNDLSLATLAPTGGTIRSDMIVLQAQDPTWSGSPWGGPAAGPIIVPAIISGVAGNATAPPGGISALALARVDLPVSTSIITQGMITDLRMVSNPNRQRGFQTMQGFW